MVRQTNGNILDMILGTDVDLNNFLLQERTAFRPMEVFDEKTDFLETEEIVSADELCVGTVTVGEGNIIYSQFL